MARTEYEATPVAAHGVSVFAGIMLIMGGAFQVIEAIVAIANDEYLLVLRNYVFSIDLTGWGWIHLLLGILVAVAGFAVMSGRLWGRSVGIILAVFSMIANFLFVPYYPVWSLLIMALDVSVIWALCLYSRDAARA